MTPNRAPPPCGRDAARAWLEAERDSWLAALRRAAAAGSHRRVLGVAEAMHWFSDLNQHWELWAEVFSLSSRAARELGSRQEEAVHLNYLAWAYNICVYDHHAALAAAEAALEAAREAGDRLQVGWALGYGAGALIRTGRPDEAITWLRDADACLGALSTTQAVLGHGFSVLSTLGTTLREQGHPAEALTVHLRAEAICSAGPPDLSASPKCTGPSPSRTSATTTPPWAAGAKPSNPCAMPWTTSRHSQRLPGPNPHASTWDASSPASATTTKPSRPSPPLTTLSAPSTAPASTKQPPNFTRSAHFAPLDLSTFDDFVDRRGFPRTGGGGG